jgi:hypothetical protein
MPDPINYSIDVQTPFQAALQGYQGGAAIRNDQLQQQQQQAALAQQQQMQKDLLELSKNPTADAIARASVRYPQLSEQFKRSYDMLNQQQQEAKVASAIPVYAALQSGRPDVASQKLRDTAAAMENSGHAEEAKRTLAWADMIEQHPEQAKLTSGLLLSSVMGPDKFATTFSTLGQEGRASEQAPGALRKANADASAAEADATKKAVDAKFAEQAAVLDLQKKGWDIKAIQEDIGFKKEANRIALMNAAAAREGNALKREELGIKIQEARQALDDKIRAKVADTESAASSIDNSLNTIERIKKNKSLDSVLGSFQGRVGAYLIDEASDAIALIDTLGSQAFLSQAANLKGMGALSNAEGEKLQSALTNLSRTQSEEQFRANLDEASRLLKKGRETLSKRSGVPLSAPDTPAAPGSRPPLSSFFKPQGG